MTSPESGNEQHRNLSEENLNLFQRLQNIHSEIGDRIARGALRGKSLSETNDEVIQLWRDVRDNYELNQAGNESDQELTIRFSVALQKLEQIRDRLG